jgi:hypothetical protein
MVLIMNEIVKSVYNPFAMLGIAILVTGFVSDCQSIPIRDAEVETKT